MLNPKLTRCLLAFMASLISYQLQSQSLPSSELYHELLKIEETKRVLYVAAHPDDENTRLISYLANEEMAQVAYLSLTRGDGGQNLIGPELGIGLGQIRTQELLKARETDGGRQFFTRAKDFGYSKNPDETLTNWEKEQILADVVWVIRKFRPDIIITRFNTIPGVTHGHHTTSAILAEEAFDLAGDPKAFPEQLKHVEVWQPKRIFWNAYNFRGEFVEEEGQIYHAFPTGNFNPLLGQTYSQIAADSRTMHKSQGFGSTAGIGEALDHIQFTKGEGFTDSPFDGVKSRWNELSNSKEVQDLLKKTIKDFDFINPESNLQNLLALRRTFATQKSKATWFLEKKEALDRLILQVLGIDFEFNTNKETGFPGSEVQGFFIFNNPSKSAVENLEFEVFNSILKGEKDQISNNQPVEIDVNFKIPDNASFSQPYWLKDYKEGDAMYTVKDQTLIGKPFNDIQIGGNVNFTLGGEQFSFPVQLFHKFNDQVDGEVKQPFTIIPKIDLSLSKEAVFQLPTSNPTLEVTVNFKDQIADGKLNFKGLEPNQYQILEVTDNPVLKQRIYKVGFLPNGKGKKMITAQYITSDGAVFDQITHHIRYKHIPNLTYFTTAEVALIQEDWKVSGNVLGYIPGAGDDVPQVLEALGYQVKMIGPADYTVEKLAEFKTIIVGIRAYNTNLDLASNQQALMGYVRSGGNLIVQYNTSSPLLTNQLGPYPFTITRDRVSVEGAEVLADYQHPLLIGPNPITASDFEGWIQERGLYFAGRLSEEYSTPLVMNDPGEDPKTGSLIYAKYGKGTYVYTGLSFFRELPAAVPGAIKLFINLIEQ